MSELDLTDVAVKAALHRAEQLHDRLELATERIQELEKLGLAVIEAADSEDKIRAFYGKTAFHIDRLRDALKAG